MIRVRVMPVTPVARILIRMDRDRKELDKGKGEWMTRAQMLDLRDELTETNENLMALLNGVDMDDSKMMRPLAKIISEMTSFIAFLDEVSQQ